MLIPAGIPPVANETTSRAVKSRKVLDQILRSTDENVVLGGELLVDDSSESLPLCSSSVRVDVCRRRGGEEASESMSEVRSSQIKTHKSR